MIKHKLRTTIKKVNGDCLTPVLIFNRLQGTRKFLLESSSKHETTGRYSFIGANPRKTYTGSGTTLTEISHLTGKSYSYEGDLVRSLKQVMPRVSNHTEYPFTGGAIGTIRFNREQSTIPAVHFQVYDTIVIYDHVKDELTVIHTNIDAEM
ncbi:MAG: metal ABC transporter ATP-binding protein, partial [Lysinibacillus sp.]